MDGRRIPSRDVFENNTSAGQRQRLWREIMNYEDTPLHVLGHPGKGLHYCAPRSSCPKGTDYQAASPFVTTDVDQSTRVSAAGICYRLCSPSDGVSTMIPLRLCGGKLLVAVTRERRYGPTRLRASDDDDVDIPPYTRTTPLRPRPEIMEREIMNYGISATLDRRVRSRDAFENNIFAGQRLQCSHCDSVEASYW